MLKRFLFLLAAVFCITEISSAQNQVSIAENTNQNAGYFNTTELSFSKGFLKENTSFYTGLQTINGYRFNKHISAGIGVGVDQYFYENYNENGYKTGETYLPVFTDMRVHFGKGKTQPFFSQAVGYMFCIRQLTEFRDSEYYNNIGGIMINPAFGVTTALSEKTALNFSLGYRFQEVTIKNIPYYYYNSYPFYQSVTWSAHYLTLKAGLTF
ncbi:hypothetical protein I5M27_06670 [Adhaeribacter sp. BT258]|uniref:Outer membrane protein beta-barrel domain-containing protein n=1 Tax=Adhaeribacter terrigena TaxID=2793070 RepID=A0ABS1BZS9_9BACT|nr:hypothetical protein [Adhaeribacter terrigena]MBK0402661.1 hypothetical protein [Adhaeribacter terrigena]